MSAPTASLKAQFDLHTRLFLNATAGITDAESHSRNSENVNHIKWIAGHLLNTRLNFMSKITGLPVDESYIEQFGRGKSLEADGNYPPFDELTGKWKDSAEAIGTALGRIPAEVLAAKSPASVPIADDTITGLLSFLISHEAYHIGQLGILRKLIGKEAMSYN